MSFLSMFSLLWALPLLWILGRLYLRSPQTDHPQAYCGPMDWLMKESLGVKKRLRLLFIAYVLGFGLLIFSLMRPVQVDKWIDSSHQGIDILLVLDVSESMDATDFKPNRIEVAKNVLVNFIKQRQNDRIGIVNFGGEAVTKSPLTTDYAFLYEQIKSIQLRELAQGTAIGMALSNGVSRLKESQSKSKVIVLLTDGDNNVGHVNPVTAAQLAKEENIKVYTIGIGKKSRVVVPIYAYDSFGQKTHLLTKVPSYLNPELLEKIASLTGGKSYMASNERGLQTILDEINTLETSPVKKQARTKTRELFFVYTFIATLLLSSLFPLFQSRYRWTKAKHAIS